jgi:hypothetical protein
MRWRLTPLLTTTNEIYLEIVPRLRCLEVDLPFPISCTSGADGSAVTSDVSPCRALQWRIGIGPSRRRDRRHASLRPACPQERASMTPVSERPRASSLHELAPPSLARARKLRQAQANRSTARGFTRPSRPRSSVDHRAHPRSPGTRSSTLTTRRAQSRPPGLSITSIPSQKRLPRTTEPERSSRPSAPPK